MIVTLQTQGLQTLEQHRTFLEGSQSLGFEVASRKDAYDFITQTLRHFRYARLGKADKVLVRRYLCKVTGCSRAQMIRRIAQFRATGRIADRRTGPARPFPRRYTRGDVLLLAEIDALHATLSGPVTTVPFHQQNPTTGRLNRLTHPLVQAHLWIGKDCAAEG